MVYFRNTAYQCPMELTLSIIGGKWKALILWHLGKKTMRFSELRKNIPKITTKMLTQQLRELEEYGLVNRFIYTQIPPRVEYSLTKAGESILPFLENLGQWGLSYAKSLEQP